MRLKFIVKLLICLLACITFTFKSAADVVVIVHPQNTANIDSATVKRIFLGKEKSFPGGNRVLAINQTASTGARAAFDSAILGRNTTQVSAYWSKLVFTGKGIPPKEVDGNLEVIDIVSRNPDAIGYVEAGSVTDEVKTIPLN